MPHQVVWDTGICCFLAESLWFVSVAALMDAHLWLVLFVSLFVSWTQWGGSQCYSQPPPTTARSNRWFLWWRILRDQNLKSYNTGKWLELGFALDVPAPRITFIFLGKGNKHKDVPQCRKRKIKLFLVCLLQRQWSLNRKRAEPSSSHWDTLCVCSQFLQGRGKGLLW